MDNTQYTLDELASEVNKQTDALRLNSSDQRTSETLSTRRIRDYVSKGMVNKPFRHGRNAIYGEHHVLQLLALRSMQADGLPEKYISKLYLNDPGILNSCSSSLSSSGIPAHRTVQQNVSQTLHKATANSAMEAIKTIRLGMTSKSHASNTPPFCGKTGAPESSSSTTRIQQWTLSGGRVQLGITDGAPLDQHDIRRLLHDIEHIVQTIKKGDLL